MINILVDLTKELNFIDKQTILKSLSFNGHWLVN